jgi:hypothetical protein
MWTSKIDRAQKLKEDLEKVLVAFFASQPYKIETKTDVQSKRLIYFVTKADEIPEEIALITGDIIQNLRSALDHLAYKLFTVGSGNGTSGRHIYFPIAEDFTEYERTKSKKTEGLAQQAKDVIDTIKPFRGGNDDLWKIHKLNIIDKHRLLVTVGSSFGSMDIGGHIVESFKRDFPHLQVPEMHLFMKPADILFPLKVGDVLFIDLPDAKSNPNLQFKFDIVIQEPGIVEGEPLIEMLLVLIEAVNSLVSIFEPILNIK